jgi:multidrug resistance efflux pump
VISQQDLDQAQSTYNAADAEVKSLEAQIYQQEVQRKYFSVFAPVDGIVG